MKIEIEDEIRSGIYCLTNLDTNRDYIGSARDLAQRSYEHLYSLSRQKHYNCDLQADYTSNTGMSFSVIEYVPVEELRLREQFHIDRFDFDSLYNRSRKANSGRRTYCFINPDGETISVSDLSNFCYSLGLQYGSMCRLHNGNYLDASGNVRTSYKGWRSANPDISYSH